MNKLEVREAISRFLSENFGDVDKFQWWVGDPHELPDANRLKKEIRNSSGRSPNATYVAVAWEPPGRNQHVGLCWFQERDYASLDKDNIGIYITGVIARLYADATGDGGTVRRGRDGKIASAVGLPTLRQLFLDRRSRPW